jgi:ferritin-like metal-binding protein YciE
LLENILREWEEGFQKLKRYVERQPDAAHKLRREDIQDQLFRHGPDISMAVGSDTAFDSAMQSALQVLEEKTSSEPTTA